MLTSTERAEIAQQIIDGTYSLNEILDDVAKAQKGEELRRAIYATLLKWVGGGTYDHRELSNRNASDQHPIEAITGLSKALFDIEKALGRPGGEGLGAVKNGGNVVINEYGEMNVSHDDLTDRDKSDQHPIEAITGLTEELNNKRPVIIATATGDTIAVSDSSNSYLHGLTLYGKTAQTTEPSVITPAEMTSIGATGSIKVTVHNKNLFHGLHAPGYSGAHKGVNFTVNADGSITFNGTTAAEFTLYLGEAVHNTAGLFVKGSNLTGVSYLCRVQTDTGKVTYLTVGSNGLYLAAGNHITRVYVQQDTVGTAVSGTLYPQIVCGDTDADYEPANPQTLTVQTPDGLPGITLTACDEINFARGAYIQRLLQFEFDGSDDEKWTIAPAENAGQYNVFVIDLSPVATLKPGSEILSNMGVKNTVAVYNHNLGLMVVNNNQLRFRYELNNDLTISDLRALLGGSPLRVILELAEPVETALSAEEITAYTALHTNKPNTVVINNAGAVMAVSYVADTRAYIDNKFAVLEAAILSTGGNV